MVKFMNFKISLEKLDKYSVRRTPLASLVEIFEELGELTLAF